MASSDFGLNIHNIMEAALTPNTTNQRHAGKTNANANVLKQKSTKHPACDWLFQVNAFFWSILIIGC